MCLIKHHSLAFQKAISDFSHFFKRSSTYDLYEIYFISNDKSLKEAEDGYGKLALLIKLKLSEHCLANDLYTSSSTTSQKSTVRLKLIKKELVLNEVDEFTCFKSVIPKLNNRLFNRLFVFSNQTKSIMNQVRSTI